VGEVFPPHSTANGKACLALLSDDEVRARLGSYMLPLAEGMRSIEDLLLELAEVRRRGIAFDEEEHSLGISAVGTAFTDGLGAIYAVSIPAPTSRFEKSRDRLVSLVLDMRHRVIAALGERQRDIIRQGEKLGALGSLFAGVAHELNNPLSVVVAQSAMLQEMAVDAKMAARSEKIRNAAERCVRIVKTFLAMARQKPPSRSAVDLNQAIEAAVELLDYTLRTSSITVRLDLMRPVPPVLADADQIGQVLMNLIANAQQALVDFNGPRRLTITTAFDDGDGVVSVAVADSGPGVPPNLRSRIFEPFLTTKPVGIGTGIGLAVCHNVVTSHGGEIAVGEAEGGGAVFNIRLPASRHASASAPAATGGARRLLVIDDEAEVAGTLSDILSEAGYAVDVAHNGRSGIEQIATCDYDLVVSNANLEDMDGVAILASLEERRPELVSRLILLVDDAPGGRIRRFLDDAGVRCLKKPFTPAEARRVVAEQLGAAKVALPA
jgi:signal transduction histidine kinase